MAMSEAVAPAFPVTPAPGWHERYLGVPYRWDGRTPDAWDCWGLCRWCWAQHFGRADLPDFHDVTTAQAGADRASRFAAQETAITAHRPAWRKLGRPVAGASVLFLIGGRPLHVGLYLGQGDFLHCDRSTATTVESLTDPEWRDRVEGFYVPA